MTVGHPAGDARVRTLSSAWLVSPTIARTEAAERRSAPAVSHRFAVQLALVTGLALAIRLGYLLTVPHTLRLGDALVYHLEGNDLAAGHGFANPLQLRFLHRSVPTAEHPPLWPLVLAGVSLAGGRSVLAHQVAGCVIGAAAVAAIGLAGRRIAGPRVGIIASALAAVYPCLWLNDARMMSETPYAFAIAVLLLVSYGYLRRPALRRAAALGAVVGLCALIRAEAVLLLLVVVGPVVVLAGTPGRRLAAGAVAAGVAAAVLAPWVIRNLLTFDHPVLLTINSDTVLVGANCAASYHGPGMGSWIFACSLAVGAPGDESDRALADRRAASSYIGHHLGRTPLVVLAREGRTWSLFRPLHDLEEPGGWTSWLSTAGFLAITPVALAGLWVMRRDGNRLAPFAGVAILVALVAALTYGTARFRLPWDVALTIPAAVAVDRALALVPRRRSGAVPTP